MTAYRRGAASVLLLIGLLAACGDPSPSPRAAGAGGPSGSAPTFSRDVAPILYTHCVGCHRPQGRAPFSLLTYDDAADRARRIAEVTASRFMPLWLPQPGGVALAGERRLGAAEIAAIQRWVETGAVEGDPSGLPPPPEAPDGDGGAWPPTADEAGTAVPPSLVWLGSRRPGLSTAGSRQVVEDAFVLPVTVEALAVRPRAPGSTVELSLRAVFPEGAVLPEGAGPPEAREIRLLEMSWLPDWQEDYRFRRPLILPAGTRLELRVVLDGAAKQATDPHRSQRRRRRAVPAGGAGETCDLWLAVVADSRRARAALERDLAVPPG